MSIGRSSVLHCPLLLKSLSKDDKLQLCLVFVCITVRLRACFKVRKMETTPVADIGLTVLHKPSIEEAIVE